MVNTVKKAMMDCDSVIIYRLENHEEAGSLNLRPPKFEFKNEDNFMGIKFKDTVQFAYLLFENAFLPGGVHAVNQYVSIPFWKVLNGFLFTCFKIINSVVCVVIFYQLLRIFFTKSLRSGSTTDSGSYSLFEFFCKLISCKKNELKPEQLKFYILDMLEEIGLGNRSMKSYYKNGNHVEAIAQALDVNLTKDLKDQFDMSRHLQLKYADTVINQTANFIRGYYFEILTGLSVAFDTIFMVRKR